MGSDAWKALERKAARILGGQRIVRADDFSQKDHDVSLGDFPGWAVDCKYRTRPFTTHTLHRDVHRKYVTEGRWDVAVIVSKTKGQHGEYVTMRLEDFGELVDRLRKAESKDEGINPAAHRESPEGA